jgi:glycosyltransferase involved in cell wall biosynthesis
VFVPCNGWFDSCNEPSGRAARNVGDVIDVVLPCLNEAAALGFVLSRMPDGYLPIVVDNGSTDATSHVARGCGAQIVHVAERGFGAAVDGGIAAATSAVVCVMDADGSFDPQQLPRVADPVVAGQQDLVLGRRRSTSFRAWPPHARLGNRYLARRLRRAGAPIYDIGPMRAFRRADLIALHLLDRRFGYPLEMIVKATHAGWRIAEVDVDYAPRIAGGRSKVTGTIRGTVRAACDMSRVLKHL